MVAVDGQNALAVHELAIGARLTCTPIQCGIYLMAFKGDDAAALVALSTDFPSKGTKRKASDVQQDEGVEEVQPKKVGARNPLDPLSLTSCFRPRRRRKPRRRSLKRRKRRKRKRRREKKPASRLHLQQQRVNN
jgi:hypothetical protein